MALGDKMTDSTEEFSLIALEDDFITSSSGLARRRPGLHPTEASVVTNLDGRRIVVGKCLRAAWYRSMEVPRSGSASAGLMMKAHIGKWDEEGLVDRWKKMGIWVDNNIKFYNKKFFLSGEMDCVIKNPETGKLIGVEVKSFYGHYANKMMTGGKRPPQPGVPRDGHFLQSILYAWEYRNQLPEFRIYYVERGDGHRVEFRIGFDEDENGQHQVWWEQIPGKYWNYFEAGKVMQPYTIEDIHARYKELIDRLARKDIPPKDFCETYTPEMVEWMWDHGKLGKTKYEAFVKNPTKNPCGDWECSYCDFSEQCKLDELSGSTKD